MFPGAHGHPQQWYDPSTDQYSSNLEMHAWATMELNTGAVALNGMEAYMIPVGYVEFLSRRMVNFANLNE